MDAAVQLLRRHYGQFVAASAVFLVPVAVLELLLPLNLVPIARLVQGLFSSVLSAAIVLMTSEAYLGHEVSVSDAVGRVLRRFFPIFFAAFYQGMLVGIGFILLVVPAFIFGAWAFAMPMVVVLEGKGVSDSFPRSRELARGNVGRILGILIPTFVVYMGALFLMGALLGVLTIAAGIGGRALEVLSTLLTALLYPIIGVVSTLLYYDLRIRKEGFDLEVMAAELGGAPAAVDGAPPPVAAGPGAPGSDPDAQRRGSIRLR